LGISIRPFGIIIRPFLGIYKVHLEGIYKANSLNNIRPKEKARPNLLNISLLRAIFGLGTVAFLGLVILGSKEILSLVMRDEKT